MEVFVVTSKAQEEDNVGIILSVKVRIHGVFTERARADSMAAKYDGAVKAIYIDKENAGDIIQYWLNPGYKS